MGNRRLSRKRLYQVEKAGVSVDLESGSGIKDAIASATQHRNGQELITEIAIDLDTSSATIIAGTSATKAIGKSGENAQITRLTKAKFGQITEIRCVCVEVPSGGIADVDLEYHASVKTQGEAVNNAVVAGLDATGKDVSASVIGASLVSETIKDKYLYVVDGTGSGSGALTGGKLLIYIHGFVAPDDL